MAGIPPCSNASGRVCDHVHVYEVRVNCGVVLLTKSSTQSCRLLVLLINGGHLRA
jgi:hypothetical protein